MAWLKDVKASEYLSNNPSTLPRNFQAWAKSGLILRALSKAVIASVSFFSLKNITPLKYQAW